MKLIDFGDLQAHNYHPFCYGVRYRVLMYIYMQQLEASCGLVQYKINLIKLYLYVIYASLFVHACLPHVPTLIPLGTICTVS